MINPGETGIFEQLDEGQAFTIDNRSPIYIKRANEYGTAKYNSFYESGHASNLQRYNIGVKTPVTAK